MSLKIEKILPEEKKEVIDTLLDAAKNVGGEQPVVSFINEILTESEKITLGRRLMVARMLLEGKKRTEIQEAIKISPNTFSKIKQWLSKQLPNYKDIVLDTSKNETASGWLKSFSFKSKKSTVSNNFLINYLIGEVTKK